MAAISEEVDALAAHHDRRRQSSQQSHHDNEHLGRKNDNDHDRNNDTTYHTTEIAIEEAEQPHQLEVDTLEGREIHFEVSTKRRAKETCLQRIQECL